MNAGPLGERLLVSRRRRFVGRAGEVELFADALASAERSFVVLFLYGPGGIGKTTLVERLGSVAAAAGATPVRLDARSVPPSPEAFAGAVAAAAGAIDGEAASAVLARRRRPVLLLDTYERLEPLDGWLREEFLPALPADVLVVIAGRNPPATGWLADPAWRDLLRVVSLRNLPPQDARAYLTTEGVPERLHDRLLAVSHGHPLTLSLLVDDVRRRGADSPASAGPRSLADVPDLVRVLLAAVVDAAPDARHRAALEVLAHARATTEDLLRSVLGGDDSPELFGWLRTLSFVEEQSDGLFPHDLARDVLDADLRWRDRDRYADLHRRIRDHLVHRARHTPLGPDRQHAVADLLFVSRSQPAMRRYLEWPALGPVYVDAPRGEDRAAILAMTDQHEGGEQAALVAHWLGRQPAAFRVFRGPGAEVVGFGARLALHEATDADRNVDPGARALWSYAQRNAPPRPGEQVLAWRFFVDREHHHRASPSLALIAAWNVEEILGQDGWSWDFIATYTDPDDWQPVMTYIDFARVEDADFSVGDRRYAVFAHDWRLVGLRDWLDRLGERELGGSPAPADQPPQLLVLSQPEFSDAVRGALRDLHAPDRLRHNPLLRSRLVRDLGGARAGAEALRELVLRAADALRADPRQEGLYDVLNRTFLHPAPTQERAAEMLHLSFSTYRRRRDRGVQRIVQELWERELHG